MPAIPEFLLRKLYLPSSLKSTPEGFSFVIKNTFTPASIEGFQLAVDDQDIPLEAVTLRLEGQTEPTPAHWVSASTPFSLPVNVALAVSVAGHPAGTGRLRIRVHTHEAGLLDFTLQASGSSPAAAAAAAPRRFALRLPRFLQRPMQVEASVDADQVIGPIHPHAYGHFIEHLEDCIYGGIWNEDGSALRPDTLRLIRDLRPSVIRYPGGNFASGYHWEDGIGPRSQRPARFDPAWQSHESNQVGTDEFMEFCAQVGAEPFLVVNDGSGTPEEAARWVAYCNEPPTGEQGRRRAANGHPQPYNVRLWGVGNEVWGQWQVGHTSAEEYAERLNAFAAAMRAADPNIKIVAVGDKVLSDQANDPGRLWNETVLSRCADQMDYLSFHLYQPDQSGWQESYDPDALHHIVCAAPLDAEAIIQRIAAQIQRAAPRRKIQIAFDEWNLWLTPPPGASSMHKLNYNLRDALYVAGMLNVFQRQCKTLTLANLAQMVNVLPLIVTNERKSYATPLYYPFLMAQNMEKLALKVEMKKVPTYSTQALGNIAALSNVPYLDIAATRDEARSRLVLSFINRHPAKRAHINVNFEHFSSLKASKAWVLNAPNPSLVNSFDEPHAVRSREIELSKTRARGHIRLDLPPASLSVMLLTADE